MAVRYIVRPNHIRTTPRKLRDTLGALRTIPVSSKTKLDFSKDLFLAYPDASQVNSAPDDYDYLVQFYRANKFTQRIHLHNAGIPIVPTKSGSKWLTPDGIKDDCSGPYVLRPMRHEKGRDFSVVDNLELFNSYNQYASQLINKEKEYRILYYKGKHVATYLKTNTNNVGSDKPWNRDNGFVFCTVYKPVNDKLINTELYENLSTTKLIHNAHLLAIDVLYLDKKAFVSEVNFCPGITIRNTLQTIKQLSL